MSEPEDLELEALQRQLDDAFETTRPRAGFEDELWTRMQSRRPAGTRLRGHEFHYASIDAPGDDAPFARMSDAHGGEPVSAGSRRGLVSGSFFHVIAAMA